MSAMRWKYIPAERVYFYVSCALSIIHDIIGVRTGATEGLCAETTKVFGPIDYSVGRGDESYSRLIAVSGSLYSINSMDLNQFFHWIIDILKNCIPSS